MDYIAIAEVIIVPVLVASITAIGSSVAVLISNKKQATKIKNASAEFMQENTNQHNENKIILNHLSGQIGVMDQKVDRLDQRLDNVQVWQAEHEKEHLNNDHNF